MSVGGYGILGQSAGTHGTEEKQAGDDAQDYILPPGIKPAKCNSQGYNY
jgi:hypothetical protein